MNNTPLTGRLNETIQLTEVIAKDKTGLVELLSMNIARNLDLVQACMNIFGAKDYIEFTKDDWTVRFTRNEVTK